MSKILLSANHIVHSFGERKILEFEKLTVYEGDRIGIVGTNGAGKTTLLNILSGELAPEEGSVTRKAPVSYFRQFRQRAEQADPQKCSEFGLSGKLCRERLSGGEMTRLSLAAMGKDAVLVFADEPTANLDADGVELCCRMLEQCPTLLLVSHDRAVLDRLCTGIIEIKDGQLHFYSGGRNLSTGNIRRKKRDWRRRPAAGTRPAKVSEKHPGGWGIRRHAFTNGRQPSGRRSWRAPEKRYSPA